MNLRARAFSVLLAAAVGATLVGCDSSEERAKNHFESGMALLEEGKPDKARLEFQNAIKYDPQLTGARYQLARLLKARNDIRAAVDQLRAVVENDPDHADARIDLAEIMLVANQIDEADRYVTAAARLRPDDLRVRSIRASVDYKKGDREKALADARAIIAQDPAQVTARLVLVAARVDDADFDGALQELDAALGFAPDDLSLNVIRLGVLEKLERVDDIGPQLETLVRHYPEIDKFHEALAKWYVFKKRYDEAEGQYRAIAANSPRDYRKALDVARFLNAVHGPERARAELERLVAEPGALVEYSLALAALDLRDGREQDAVDRLDRIIAEKKSGEGAGKAMLERAKIHIRKAEYEQADTLLDSLLKQDPKNSAALTLRASRHLAVDDNEKAIRDLRAALDVAPDDVQVLLMLAGAYERDGSRELALERLGQAVQKSDYLPDVVLRYTQALIEAQKIEVAESLLLDALKRRGDRRDLLTSLAQIKLRQQNWKAAEQVARRLRDLDPEDETAGRLEAAAALGQRKFAESADILQGLVKDGQEGDAGLIALIRALLAGGDVDRAAAFLDRRLSENPDDTTALVLRASIVAGKGDLEAAEADLKRAIELEPGNAAAYASLARIYNSLGKSDEVSAAIDKGVAMNDKDVALRLTQAMQAEYQGDFDEAIEIYGELYKERPNSAVVANNFASLLADHRADDPATVERAFNIARRFRDSTQPHLMDTYAWLLHLTGATGEALPILRRAADLLPTNPTVQYHLGVVLAASGELSQARQQVTRAIELSEQVNFPQKDRARDVLQRIDALEAEALRIKEEDARRREQARPQGVTQ